MAGTKNDTLIGKNADFSQVGGPNATSSDANGLNTNGQLWIGATAANAGGTHINVGTLTSPDSSITFGFSSPNITAQVTGGSTSVVTLTGNSGVATPSAGNINVITANTTVKFVGSGSTLTQDFGLTNLILGNSGASIAGAQGNVGLGLAVLNALSGGLRNTAIGAGALQHIVGDADNTAVGYQALTACVGSNNNTAVGSSCLVACTSGGSNVGVGQSALGALVTNGSCVGVGYSALISATGGENIGVGFSAMLNLTSGTKNCGVGQSVASNLLTGTQNIFMGYGTGQGYVGAESSNILIGNNGTAAESNVMRLGTQGSGAGQQLQTHIAGVINTVSGRVVKITSPGAYPYTTLTTDYVILVDTSSARTIVPLAAPVTGTTYRIKDSVGSAAANNITITPSGKNIDGAASYVINNAYGAVDIVYNGSEWNKF